MSGTFGYELNPALLSAEEKAEIRTQLAKYREHQELIREGSYYRLSDPFQDEISAWMVVSENQEQALVGGKTECRSQCASHLCDPERAR